MNAAREQRWPMLQFTAPKNLSYHATFRLFAHTSTKRNLD